MKMGIGVRENPGELDYTMNTFYIVSLYMSIMQIHPDIVVNMGSDVRRTGIWWMTFRNDIELQIFLEFYVHGPSQSSKQG